MTKALITVAQEIKERDLVDRSSDTILDVSEQPVIKFYSALKEVQDTKERPNTCGCKGGVLIRNGERVGLFLKVPGLRYQRVQEVDVHLG